jgi:hypothetical protein
LVMGDIADKLLGQKYGDMVRYHSRAIANKCCTEVSVLCAPDKLSIILYPAWLYILLGRMTGEILEYKSRMGLGHVSDREWLWKAQVMSFIWVEHNVPGRYKSALWSQFRFCSSMNLTMSRRASRRHLLRTSKHRATLSPVPVNGFDEMGGARQANTATFGP